MTVRPRRAAGTCQRGAAPCPPAFPAAALARVALVGLRILRHTVDCRRLWIHRTPFVVVASGHASAQSQEHPDLPFSEQPILAHEPLANAFMRDVFGKEQSTLYDRLRDLHPRECACYWFGCHDVLSQRTLSYSWCRGMTKC